MFINLLTIMVVNFRYLCTAGTAHVQRVNIHSLQELTTNSDAELRSALAPGHLAIIDGSIHSRNML